MNYDLNTEDGRANAVAWANRIMGMLNNGGAWQVPRSGTLVRMIDREKRQVQVISGFTPDESITQVLRAGGWHVEEKTT